MYYAWLQFGDASQMIYNKFDIILEVLMLLTALVECRSPHNNYLKCLRNICDTTLSVMFLSDVSCVIQSLGCYTNKWLLNG